MRQMTSPNLASKSDFPALLFDYLHIFWKRKWWLLIPLPISLIVALILLHVLPKSYVSSTLILVEAQKIPEDYVKSPVSGTIEDRLATIRQQMLSRSLLKKIIDEFSLYKKEMQTLSLDEVISLMQKRIEIHTVGAHQVVDAFTISFEGNDPKTTMDVTNKLASLYIEENLKIREQLVEGTTDFLEKELQSLKESLDQQEQKISKHKQQFMGEMPEQLDANLRTLDRYQQELQTISSSLKVAEDRRESLEKSLNAEADVREMRNVGAEEPATPTEQERYLGQQYSQLVRMKKELENLKADYTDSYPDIIVLKKKIKDQELEVSRLTAATGKERNHKPVSAPVAPRYPPVNLAVENAIGSISEEVNTLKERQKTVTKKVQRLEKEVEMTPFREQEMMSLIRDYENTKRAYQALLEKQYNAKLSESLEKRQKGEQFRIIDPANLPTKPSRPNLFSLIAVCLAGGAGSGIGLIFLIEKLDTSFRKSEEIEKEFGIVVLGEIPNFMPKKTRDKLEKTIIFNRTQKG